MPRFPGFLPFRELAHVEEAVAVLPGQLELGGQREHGLIEVSQDRLHGPRVLVAVVNVVIQTDELPAKPQHNSLLVSYLYSYKYNIL